MMNSLKVNTLCRISNSLFFWGCSCNQQRLCGAKWFVSRTISSPASFKVLKKPLNNKPFAINTNKFSSTSIKLGFIDYLRRTNFVKNLKYTQQVRLSGCQIYENVEKVNYNEFFEAFKMPDTFHSWFVITELHVWMMLIRLNTGPEKYNKLIITHMIETMWEDSEARSKLLAPHSPLVKKQVADLNSEFRLTLMLYDEGLQSSDADLANALWFRFLNKRTNDPRLVESLISYVRYQLDYVMSISHDDLTQFKPFKWQSLTPHLKTNRPLFLDDEQ